MRRRLLTTIAVGLALSVIPVVAHACSCYLGDPRDALDEADGAFIGTYLTSRPVNPERPWGAAIYTFRVSEEIKGDFDETVEVRSQTQSTACGLAVREGRETGLLLYRTRSGGWTSSSCSQLSPAQMREAASELPPATSEGPARFVVGGSFHNEHSVSLDASGEIVAYGGPGGEPESEAQELAVCPGERRFIEVVHQYRHRARVIVRDLSSFEIERQFTLPFGRKPYRRHYVTAVVCRDEAATDVFVFASDHYFTGRADATSYLQHVGPDGPDQIIEGNALQASFTPSHAYLNGGRNGRKVSRLDLDTGERTFIAWVPPRPGPFTLSPDGSMLAAVAEGRATYDSPPSRAVLIELGNDPRVISTSLHAKYVRGDMRWIGHDRVALLTPYIRRSRIYDPSLTLVERLAGWDATDPSVDGNTVYGLGFEYDGCFCSKLVAYDLDTQETSVVARPPTRVTNALALLTR